MSASVVVEVTPANVVEIIAPGGPPGPVGAQGAPGAPGADGVQGPPGVDGAQGPAGATGAQGPKGDKGDPGAAGATGGSGPAGATGATGATGADGPMGPTGPPGAANALYSAEWTWTTKTADANTSGQVGVNAGTWAGVTQVNLNEQRADNTDVSHFLARFNVGDEFYVQVKTDASRYGLLRITGAPTDHGTWWSWPVTLVESRGTFPGGSTPMRVTLLTEGATVEEWLEGSGAPAGTLGKVGDWYLDGATGDVYEKTAASAWTLRCNIKGPAGSGGGASTVIGCRIDSTDALSVASGAWTPVPAFNSVRYDTGGFFDASMFGANQIAIQGHAGIWDLYGLAQFEHNANGVRGILLGAEGGSPANIQGCNVAPAGAPFAGGARSVLSVVGSFYSPGTGYFPLTLWLYQDSGVALNVGGFGGSLELAAHYRGPVV